MAISSPGVGSNLDVNSIVSSLMQTEQAPLTLLNNKVTSYQTKISAYGSLKSVLSTFQSTLSDLASPSKFNTQNAVSSDSSIFTATTNGNAVQSTYSVKVSQLAQSQKIALSGMTDVTSAIGTGKLTISFGSYDDTAKTFSLNSSQAAATIDIDSSNNSLTGIRDAINAANIGVSATIVNDGQTNRLIVTSKNSGTANSIKISVTDDDAANGDNSGLSQLAFDPAATIGAGKNMSVLQPAKDAIVSIDGLTVTKSSNVITDAVDGITFNLLKESPSTTASLTVSRDSSSIESSVNAFVKAFNDANQTIRDLTKYDATTKKGGALLGDAATRSIASQIKQVLSSVVNSSGNLKSLTDLGVSFQRDGTLAVDSTKLKSAIQNYAAEIPTLFAASGKATDSLLKQTGQTDKTVAGTYAINVSRLATQGSAIGNAAPGLTITQGVNDHLDITVDGIAYGVTLQAGAYNAASDLATELQTKLSAAGSAAKVALNGGNLQLTSSNYGASSSVTLAGNGVANVFGGSPVTSAGVDVAGTINGVAATGLGQQLIGATGDASEGLSVQVTGGSLGSRGTVTFMQGYAYQLNKAVKGLLGTDGLLTARTDGINSSIARLNKQQEAMQTRLADIEKRYRAQFTALDKTISSLQQTSTFLTQQIAQFQANSKSS